MVEIRKHYPAPEAKKEEPPVVKKVYKNSSPEETKHNTVQLINNINRMVADILEKHICISYHYLHAEIFTAMKLKALEVCSDNTAGASRLIGMKRTTFRESLRIQRLKNR